MTTILIVDKLGSIKELVVKSYTESDLYKKAGFKSSEGFKLQSKWDVFMNDRQLSVCLYGKTTGRGMHENKYEFPPPVDSLLLFGNCILVLMINDMVVGFSKNEWTSIYERLYGGFTGITESDESSSDEEEHIDNTNIVMTKEGYEKNDFVVDDVSSNESYVSENVSVVSVRKSLTKRKPVDKTKASRILESVAPEQDIKNTNYMECSMELDEEEYI